MSSFCFGQIILFIIASFIESSEAKHNGIFGNVSRQMEIIYIALICVAGVCILSCFAYIIYRKCLKNKSSTKSKDSSYEKVVSERGSIVNYVDENNENEKIMNIQMPLNRKQSIDRIKNLENETQEGNENETMTTTTNGYQSNILSIPDQYERDDSISAMDI